MILPMAKAEQEKSESVRTRRMTIGEHLDELRLCLMRSVIAFVIACIICIWPAQYLLEIIARPVIMTLQRHGQPASLLATGPVEAILIYIKVVVFAALIISGPYIIYQIWSFVASGLYQHEKRVVVRLVPVSVGLFFTGVIFMYVFALVVALNFLVGFGSWLPAPSGEPTALERMLLGDEEAAVLTTQPVIEEAPQVPLYAHDPEEPPTGAVWYNISQNKLKVRAAEETYSLQLTLDRKHSLVTTHFKIGEYLTFVLVLTVAFGVAFQMPLVVVFLVRSGIVSVQTLRSYRRVVILLIVIIAGMIAPPDILSHLLLSGPMVLLFEIGLLFAARGPKPEARPRAEAEDEDA